MRIKVTRPSLSNEERERRVELLKEATINFYREVERSEKKNKC